MTSKPKRVERFLARFKNNWGQNVSFSPHTSQITGLSTSSWKTKTRLHVSQRFSWLMNVAGMFKCLSVSEGNVALGPEVLFMFLENNEGYADSCDSLQA